MKIWPFWMVVVLLINSHPLLGCVPNIPNQSVRYDAPLEASPVQFYSSQISSSTSTKFTASNKTAETYRFDERIRIPRNLIKMLARGYTKSKFKLTRVLQITDFSSRNVSFQNNGFVSTILAAYGGHHNLIIRPDDVWTAIMVQFSFYLNAHAEEYRSRFVQHTGQKHLVVSLPGSLDTVPYNVFISLMTNKIDENLVDRSVKDWALPNFSTTTEEDRVSVGVVFMAALKHYFSYEFGITCGIPEVTLEGSIGDWQNIRNRLRKLKEYDLDWWYLKLDWILENFISAKQGKVNKHFWETVVQKDPRFICGRDDFSGWLTAFAVFNEKGDKHCSDAPKNWLGGSRDYFGGHGGWNECNINDNEGSQSWFICDLLELPNGMAMVDVQITDGVGEYNASLFGGHMGTEMVDAGYSLKPAIGWLIALKSN